LRSGMSAAHDKGWPFASWRCCDDFLSKDGWCSAW
jgi:hypothetical protein